MSLSRDLEVKLRQIVSGFFHVRFKGKLYKFFEPTNSIYAEVALYTEALSDELKAEGFLTKDEELSILKDRGLWSDEKEKSLETMKADLEKLLSEKPKYKYQSKALKAIDASIAALQKSIKESSDVRNSLFFNSIEYQRIYRTNVILLSECIRNVDGSKAWKSYEDLEISLTSSDVDELMKLTFGKDRFESGVVRCIARSEPWRTIWKTATKVSGDLFGKPISDVTKSQYELCYWSNVYDSVYESTDYPGQDVIEDDEALDAWFIEQGNKYSKNRKNKDSFTSNKKIANASEVFLVTDTPEDAAKVYEEMNTEEAKAIIKSRTEKIEAQGHVLESELPDVKQNIMMQINNLMVKSANGKR